MQLPKVKPSQKKQLTKLKIRIAKFLAFTVLVIAASYGFRSMLNTLQEPVQLALTVVAVLAMVFIITLKED